MGELHKNLRLLGSKAVDAYIPFLAKKGVGSESGNGICYSPSLEKDKYCFKTAAPTPAWMPA